jgi:hypothetical protein
MSSQERVNTSSRENPRERDVAIVNYPTSFRLGALIGGLALAVFLYGLDQTIIATAIPKITDHFHALTDIGWYAASYLFTSSEPQQLLAFGRHLMLRHLDENCIKTLLLHVLSQVRPFRTPPFGQASYKSYIQNTLLYNSHGSCLDTTTYLSLNLSAR